MLWVDHQNYFGPDRRREPGALRLRERRRYNCATHPPQLRTALTQLRLRALEAQEPQLGRFIERTLVTAMLADLHREPDAARELASLGARLDRHRDEDMRPTIYEVLDRANRALRNC